jgi:hypothetical protein
MLHYFVRGRGNEFYVTEELASLMAMKGTTACEDLHKEIKEVMEKLNIPILKSVEL